MAEKILQTRIINKNATLADWNSSSLKLKQGEIALAFVNAQTTDAKGNIIHVPTCVMKVGQKDANGNEQAFKDLPFLSAPASDVYAWAKAQKFDEAGNLPNTNAAIKALQDAIGVGGSVAAQIESAIVTALAKLALDEVTVGTGKIIGSIKQENGKVVATTRDLEAADIPTLAISKIDGLQAALDSKATATGLADEVAAREALGRTVAQNTADITKEAGDRAAADTALGQRIDGVAGDLTEEINRAKAAEQANATAAANAQAKADKAEDDAATVAGNLTQEVADRQAADELLNTAITNAVNELKGQIGNLSNIMNFRGAVEDKANVETPVEGDVIVVTAGDDKGKEFVYSNGDWVEFGSVDAQQTAINGLLERMGAAEGEISTIKTDYAKKADVQADIQSLTTRIANEESARGTADTALGGRIDGVVERVGTAEGKITTAEGKITTLEGKVGTLETKVGTIETTYATISAMEAADATVKAIADRAEGKADANKTAHDEYVTSNDARVKAVEDKNTEQATAITNLGTNKADKTALDAVDGRVLAIENNYVKITNDQLVDQAGDVIVFDCGGAE